MRMTRRFTILAFLALALSACAGSTPAPVAAPTVATPTAAAPATAASTVVAPSTVAPATAASVTAAPTFTAPTVAAPTVAEATAPARTAAAPTTVAPTVAGSSSTAPAGAGQTAGQLAEQGKTVFASHCAKCHGDQGQGVTAPANIGPNAQLDKYSTAKGLYDYVSTLMPNDAPGSLTPDEYLQVTSFLLLQNNFVTPETPISPSTLGGISLTK